MDRMKTTYYRVGGHVFSVSADEGLAPLMKNYEPFVCGENCGEGDKEDVSGDGNKEDVCGKEDLVFALTIGNGSMVDYTEERRQEEEEREIICGNKDGKPVFEFTVKDKTAGQLVCEPDYGSAQLILSDIENKLAIDNSLMILYALATSCKGTALFHSAVVSKDGKGYMFLGKSGTGKSTHACLWLKYVEGSALMNDDNPVVRVTDEGVMVYGSPWSGKTPCYRNVSAPLGGIVLLSQAPYNKIKRLEGVAAYAAVLPSISGKRWDSRMADGLHQTENALAMKARVWFLECLPDEAAARLSYETIK